MLCPNDGVQMHQKNKLGGGKNSDNYYETWEIKECPKCGRLVKEFYSVTVLSEVEACMEEYESMITIPEEYCDLLASCMMNSVIVYYQDAAEGKTSGSKVCLKKKKKVCPKIPKKGF